eukprot:1701201-Rhodomonas_salina.2
MPADEKCGTELGRPLCDIQLSAMRRAVLTKPTLASGVLSYPPTRALCDVRYQPTRALCDVRYQPTHALCDVRWSKINALTWGIGVKDQRSDRDVQPQVDARA